MVPATRREKSSVPGTVAVVRSSEFLRASERATALATLVRQRRLTPSCGGHAPTAERTVGPARMIVESLTPRPGIREHYLQHISLVANLCCNGVYLARS
jgi:hypothetical protein